MCEREREIKRIRLSGANAPVRAQHPCGVRFPVTESFASDGDVILPRSHYTASQAMVLLEDVGVMFEVAGVFV